MESLLSQLNTVPGVVGSLVADAEGVVLAKVFPELFDPGMLHNVAKVLSDGSIGLEAVTGPLGMADFRFGDSRLFVKPFPGALLLVLGAKSVNPELLSISCQVAIRKMEKLLADRKAAQAEAASLASEVRAAANRSAETKDSPESKRPEGEGKEKKATRPAPKWWPSV
jgi:predicted regulator of Ras-like GTPase activity (Roadblock/LC7/MglB family)